MYMEDVNMYKIDQIISKSEIIKQELSMISPWVSNVTPGNMYTNKNMEGYNNYVSSLVNTFKNKKWLNYLSFNIRHITLSETIDFKDETTRGFFDLVAAIYTMYGTFSYREKRFGTVHNLSNLAKHITECATLCDETLKSIYENIYNRINPKITKDHYVAGEKIFKILRRQRQNFMHKPYVNATPGRNVEYQNIMNKKGYDYTEKLQAISRSTLKNIQNEIKSLRTKVNGSAHAEEAFLKNFTSLKFLGSHYTDTSVTGLLNGSFLNYVHKRCESALKTNYQVLNDFCDSVHAEFSSKLHISYLCPDFFKGIKSQTTLNKGNLSYIDNSGTNVKILRNGGYAFFRFEVANNNKATITNSRFGIEADLF